MCDRFPRKFDVQTSCKPSNVIFVVNIKFPQAIYHTIVPSTEELYRLILNEIVDFKLNTFLRSSTNADVFLSFSP